MFRASFSSACFSGHLSVKAQSCLARTPRGDSFEAQMRRPYPTRRPGGAIAFNDAAFIDASGPFWYGDVRPGGTQLTDMQNNYNCFFLRKTFLVTNASQVGALRLTYFIDDGFVAWINGRELYRERVSDPITTNTVAAQQPLDPAPLTNKQCHSRGCWKERTIIACRYLTSRRPTAMWLIVPSSSPVNDTVLFVSGAGSSGCCAATVFVVIGSLTSPGTVLDR